MICGTCTPECPARDLNCDKSSTGCSLEEGTLFEIEDREHGIKGWKDYYRESLREGGYSGE